MVVTALSVGLMSTNLYAVFFSGYITVVKFQSFLMMMQKDVSDVFGFSGVWLCRILIAFYFALPAFLIFAWTVLIFNAFGQKYLKLQEPVFNYVGLANLIFFSTKK